MKLKYQLLPILTVLVFATPAFAWPWDKKPTPTPAPISKPTTINRSTTVTQKIDQAALIAKIKGLLAQQMTELKTADAAAAEALKEKADAQNQVNEIGKQRDQWEAYGKQQDALRQAAELKVAAQSAALLRRDILIGILGLAIAAYVGLRLFTHLPI